MSDESPVPPPPAPPEPPPLPAAAPPPPPGPPQRNVLMLVLAYFGILALIPLLVEKNDREVQWHAKHGLVLLVFDIVLMMGFGVMCAVIHFLFVFYPFLSLGILALHLVAIMKAVSGQKLLIPGISDFADRM